MVAERVGVGSEEDEDTTSQSDPSEIAHDGDSDSDNERDDRDEGDAGGNGGGHQDADPRDDGENEDGGERSEDLSKEESPDFAPGMTPNSTSASYDSPSSTSDATTHTVIYGIPSPPPLPYRPQSGPRRSFRVRGSHRLRSDQVISTFSSFSASIPSHYNSSSSEVMTWGLGDSDSTPQLPNFQPLHSALDLRSRQYQPSDPQYQFLEGIGYYSAPPSQPNDSSRPPSWSNPSTNISGYDYYIPSSSSIRNASPVLLKSGDSYPYRSSPPTAPPPPNEPPLNSRRLSMQPASFHEMANSVTAPNFNGPASTAMLSSQSQPPRSTQEREGEQLIRNLLVFQSFDGSFNFGTLDRVKEHLGEKFASVVRDLQAEVSFDLAGADFELAVTVSIMALFVEKFQYCSGLWVLVWQKSKDYIDQRLQKRSFERLYRSARDQLQLVDVSEVQYSAALESPPVPRSVAMQDFVGFASSVETPTQVAWMDGWGVTDPDYSRMSPPKRTVADEEDLPVKRVVVKTAPIDG